MQLIQKILVVSRSTRYCRKAVEIGVSLARMYSARLYVLHVFHDTFYTEGWNLRDPTAQEEYLTLIEKYKNDLHEVIMKEKSQGLDITEWVRDEKPLDGILTVVEAEKFDLIIMLAHEEGRIEHFLFGQTNDAILRKMPCSVLFVKSIFESN